MRKILMFNMISVDGYFEDSKNSIDWHTVDDEFNEFAIHQQGKDFDTLLFGRKTYDLFESFWPTISEQPNVSKEDVEIGRQIDEKRKIVVSKTRKSVTWKNSEILEGDLETEVKKLKEEDGGNIMIYGSGKLVRALTDLGLIDEYRIMISPTILGSGANLFDGVQQKNLKLVSSRSFKNGNVLLTYNLK